MTERTLMRTRDLARYVGVEPRRVSSWYARRAGNGFPEAAGRVEAPQYGGDHVGAPLFDLDEVLEWLESREDRRGKHWQAKRGDGVPPKNRGTKVQEAWKNRRREGRTA